MASRTFLNLTNDVLEKTGEVVLTSSNFTSSRGVQSIAKQAVLDAVNIIMGSEQEWPFNVVNTTVSILPGIARYALPTDYSAVDWGSFYLKYPELLSNNTFDSDLTSWTDISVSTGTAAQSGGKAVLTGGTNDGAIEQSITTVANRDLLLSFEHSGNGVVLKLGTASGGVEIQAATTYSIENTGELKYQGVIFRPTTATTYIGFYNSSTTAVNLDNIYCSESEEDRPLIFRSEDYHNQIRASGRVFEETNNPDTYKVPEFIVPTQDDKFILSPTPEKKYSVEHVSWVFPTAMSASGSTSSIPARYDYLIVAYAQAVILSYRADLPTAQAAEKILNVGIAKMRRDLINKTDYFRGSNVYTSTRRFSGRLGRITSGIS